MSEGTPAAAPATEAGPAEQTATPAAGPLTPSAKPAAPKAPEKFKVGDLEFSSIEDAKAEIARGRQSNKLLTEADKRLKAAAEKERTLDDLKKSKSFKRYMEITGMSREEAAEEAAKYFYETEILPKEMSPEARRAAEAEARLKEYEEREKTAKQKEREAALARQTQEEVVKLRTELEGILNSKKIPGTRFALRRVAEYKQAYLDQGVDVPTSVAVDRVLADYRSEFGGIMDEATPEQLISFLGQERFQKLAKKVSQWVLSSRKTAAPEPQPAMSLVNRQEQPRRRSLSPQQFQELLNKGGAK